MNHRYLNRVLAAAALLLSAAAGAATPLPEIAPGKGDKCVEPTEDMRRHHMEYLLHQRDETMHRGIRTKRHSLKNCIECHAVKDQSGAYVTVEDKRHFCRTCHNYAAVTIDCFECHRSTPEPSSASLGAGGVALFEAAGRDAPQPEVSP